MFGAFDEGGRLFVAESSGLDLYGALKTQTRLCRISRLEDRDHDGIYEISTVFADGLVFPMGLAWRDGKLYVADPPDLVTLEDLDGDGKSDRRQVILSGFGHQDNGSLHGLVFGPDGLLYMTMGSPDGYRFRRSDGTLLEGKNGALLRCNPDGSNPEVLCTGFENLVEIIFLPGGEVIGTDNWFTKPSGGLRDALVHLEPGGRYPLDLHEEQPALSPTGELLPAIAQYPAVALSGLTLYRGKTFPEPMRGSLFSAQHNSRKVEGHRLIRKGATFDLENFPLVTSDDPDFHPSDVLEAADGSLIVIDTGGWYIEHCPTGKIRNSQAPGGIYRVRFAEGSAVADAWGNQVDWPHLSADRLVDLLSDDRPFVRDRAQYTIAKLGSLVGGPLEELLRAGHHLATKAHAIWALAAIPGETSRSILRQTLTFSEEPTVIALAARALSWICDSTSRPAFEKLLTHSNSSVRLAAAQALARCGTENSVEPLLAALSRTSDEFEEHGHAFALQAIATSAQFRAALQWTNPNVRRVALIGLDQPSRHALEIEDILQSLSASDPKLRAVGIKLLQRHPEWASRAATLAKDWLKSRVLLNEHTEALRNLIPAFQTHSGMQEVVAAALKTSSENSDASRIFLWETISQCSLRPWPKLWTSSLGQTLRDPSPAVRSQAVRVIAFLRFSDFDERLTELAKDGTQPLELRFDALRALTRDRRMLGGDLVEFLLGQISESKPPLQRLMAGEILGRMKPNDEQQQRILAAATQQTLVSPSVLLPALHEPRSSQTDRLLLNYLESGLSKGWRPASGELEKILSTIHSDLQSKVRGLLASIDNSLTNSVKRLAELEALLKDGDAVRGRVIFFGSKAACGTCHRIEDTGGLVGPDLTRVGAIRSGRDLIESIVFPSSTFAQGYEPYSITLHNGEEFNGNIVQQNSQGIGLRDSSGAIRQIFSAEIKSIERRTTSLMPSGFDSVLSRDELRDLLSFLQNAK